MTQKHFTQYKNKMHDTSNFEIVVSDQPIDLIDEWDNPLTKIKIPRKSGYDVIVTFEEVVLGKTFTVMSVSKKTCKISYVIKDKLIPQVIVDQYDSEEDLKYEILAELNRL